jgi:membrane protein YqaA with SNARE-associated domain
MKRISPRGCPKCLDDHHSRQNELWISVIGSVYILNIFLPVLSHLTKLGYFGPFVMGVLDSSFLFLPFGNDLLVVALVAQGGTHVWIYVFTAAVGSTLGAMLLVFVSRPLGEAGIRQLAGERLLKKLQRWMEGRAAIAITASALAPPPFPYSVVVAAAGAMKYPLWRILLVNFCARALRFTILVLLAQRFGKGVIQIAQSAPFRWSMMVLVAICVLGSALSVRKWLKSRKQRPIWDREH